MFFLDKSPIPRFLLGSILASSAYLSSCTPTAPQTEVAFALPASEKLSALNAEQRKLLRATLEIDEGVLGESPLKVASGSLVASGIFELPAVVKPEEHGLTLRLYGRLSEESSEVLLARLQQTITLTPNQDNQIAVNDLTGFDTCLPAVDGACALIFDENRNGFANLDDLQNGVDPAPQLPFLDVAPNTLQFPSGIRLGSFARQVIVLENTGINPMRVLRVEAVDGQGVSLALLSDFDNGGLSDFDFTQPRRRIDIEEAEVFGASPLEVLSGEEALVAVSFAPVNGFLTTGDVHVVVEDTITKVRQAARIKIIANPDGILQPADPNYDPELREGSTLDAGGVAIPIQLFPAGALYSGVAITGETQNTQNGGLTGLTKRGGTLVVPIDEDTGRLSRAGVAGVASAASAEDIPTERTVPVDGAFLVELEPESRLSVSLGNSGDDVDLSVVRLNRNDRVVGFACPTCVSSQAGSSPEGIELINDTGEQTRYLILVGIPSKEPPPPPIPNALSDDGSAVAFDLVAHTTTGPSFADTTPLNPVFGPIEGGTRVALRGRGFQDGARVTFADSEALDIVIETAEDGSQTIFCTLPPGSLENGKNPASVVVANPSVADGGDGQAATLPEAFTYEPPAPRLNAIAPAKSPVQGSDVPVQITGTFFSSRFGNPLVFFGSAQAEDEDVTFIDANHLAVIPPASLDGAGIVNVSVQNRLEGERTSTASNGLAFEYIVPLGNAPTISSISPNQIFTDDDTQEIIIDGTDFREGVDVFVGNQPALDVTRLSETQIRATAPARSEPAQIDVSVINTDGTGITRASGLSYNFPPMDVTSVFPDRVPASGGTLLIVNGSGFREGARASFISNDGQEIASNNVQRVSATTLLVLTPTAEPDENYALHIRQGSGDNAEEVIFAPFGFVDDSEILPPEIALLDPPSAPADSSIDVDLVGKGFIDPLVIFDGVTLTPQVGPADPVTGLQRLRVQSPRPSENRSRIATVQVINRDNGLAVASNAVSFSYVQVQSPGPRINSVAPRTGLRTGGFVVTLSGNNFRDNNNNFVQVRVGGQNLPDRNIVSRDLNSIRFTVPQQERAGVLPIQVFDDLGRSDLTFIELTDPTTLSIRSLVPAEVSGEGNVSVVLLGTGLRSDGILRINDVPVNYQFVDSELISFVAPAHPNPTTGGSLNVTFTLDGTTVRSSLQYRAVTPAAPPPPVPAFSAQALSPSLVSAVGGEQVLLVGTGFNDTLQIKVNGTLVARQIVDGNLASFVAPAHPDVFVGGAIRVEVSQTANAVGGAGNAALNLQYQPIDRPEQPAPFRVQALTPRTVSAVGGDQVVILGTGFTNNTRVFVGGNAVELQIHSSTLASFFAPAHPDIFVGGPVVVTLKEGAGEVSQILQYQPISRPDEPPPIPVFTVQAITPTVVNATGGDQVVILGTGFSASLSVFVNGKPIAARVSSDTLASFIVPASADIFSDTLIDISVVQDGTAFAFQALAKAAIRPDEPPPAPVFSVQTITPSVVSTLGGEQIVLFGTGFNSGLQVRANGEGLPVNVQSSTLASFIITTRADIFSDQDVLIEVIQDGVRAEQRVFARGVSRPDEPPPAPTFFAQALTPTVVSAGGGDEVILLGTAFNSTLSLFVDGNPIEVRVISDTLASFIVPPRADPFADQSLFVDAVQDGRVFAFRLFAKGKERPEEPPPVPVFAVQAVTPSVVSTLGGEQIVLFGTGFNSRLQVRANGEDLPVNVQSSTLASFIITTRADIFSDQDVLIEVIQDGVRAEQRVFARAVARPDEPPPAPTFVAQALTPTVVSAGGGDEVILLGTAFNSTLSLFVDGNPIEVRVISDTLASFIVPPRADPFADQSLFVDAVQDGRVFAFRLFAKGKERPEEPPPAPVFAVQAVTPSSVSAGGGDQVVILGTGFNGDLRVRIDGILIGVSVPSSTLASFVLPPRPNPFVDQGVIVEVEQNGVLVTQVLQARRIENPNANVVPFAVQAITPSVVEKSGGEEILILGTGFDPTLQVRVDGQPVATRISGTTVAAFVAPPQNIREGDTAADGSVLVEIEQAGAVQTFVLVYRAPSVVVQPVVNVARIFTIDPPVFSTTNFTTVSILGENFQSIFDPAVSPNPTLSPNAFLEIDGLRINNSDIFFATSNQIVVNVPPRPFPGAVLVRYFDENSVATIGARYEAPAVGRIFTTIPDQVPYSVSTPIVILGEGFASGMVARFPGGFTTGVEILSSTAAQIFVPPLFEALGVSPNEVPPEPAQIGVAVSIPGQGDVFFNLRYFDDRPPAPFVRSVPDTVLLTGVAGERIQVNGRNLVNQGLPAISTFIDGNLVAMPVEIAPVDGESFDDAYQLVFGTNLPITNNLQVFLNYSTVQIPLPNLIVQDHFFFAATTTSNNVFDTQVTIQGQNIGVVALNRAEFFRLDNASTVIPAEIIRGTNNLNNQVGSSSALPSFSTDNVLQILVRNGLPSGRRFGMRLFYNSNDVATGAAERIVSIPDERSSVIVEAPLLAANIIAPSQLFADTESSSSNFEIDVLGSANRFFALGTSVRVELIPQGFDARDNFAPVVGFGILNAVSFDGTRTRISGPVSNFGSLPLDRFTVRLTDEITGALAATSNGAIASILPTLVNAPAQILWGNLIPLDVQANTAVSFIAESLEVAGVRRFLAPLSIPPSQSSQDSILRVEVASESLPHEGNWRICINRFGTCEVNSSKVVRILSRDTEDGFFNDVPEVSMPISIRDPYQARLDFPGDIDHFSFVARAGEFLTLRLSDGQFGCNGNLNIELLRLEGSDGQFPVGQQFDDNGGPFACGKIFNFSSPTSSIYIARVTGDNTVAYTLDVIKTNQPQTGSPLCGDGFRNFNEQCDENDFFSPSLGRPRNCSDFGFGDGILRCDLSCRIDTGECF